MKPIRERRTSERTVQYWRKEMPKRKAYPSDLTDAQWEILEPLIPAVAEDATNISYERREIVNGILYVLRSGCPWRLVPHDLPAWGTLYWYFRTWRNEGVWDQIMHILRRQVRHKQGRDPEPSAAVIDSQSIKTRAVRGPEKGFDRGKNNLGAQATRARGYARPALGGEGDGCRGL
jgi:transposase